MAPVQDPAPAVLNSQMMSDASLAQASPALPLVGVHWVRLAQLPGARNSHDNPSAPPPVMAPLWEAVHSAQSPLTPPADFISVVSRTPAQSFTDPVWTSSGKGLLDGLHTHLEGDSDPQWGWTPLPGGTPPLSSMVFYGSPVPSRATQPPNSSSSTHSILPCAPLLLLNFLTPTLPTCHPSGECPLAWCPMLREVTRRYQSRPSFPHQA